MDSRNWTNIEKSSKWECDIVFGTIIDYNVDKFYFNVCFTIKRFNQRFNQNLGLSSAKSHEKKKVSIFLET